MNEDLPWPDARIGSKRLRFPNLPVNVRRRSKRFVDLRASAELSDRPLPNEDTTQSSFAGLYRTNLDVALADIEAAIKDLWASLTVSGHGQISRRRCPNYQAH
jgi:hypothetical protein